MLVLVLVLLCAVVPWDPAGGADRGVSGAMYKTPPNVVAHARIATLLDHALDAAAYFIPTRWLAALPQPMSTVELLGRWHYPVESWQVETPDGHVLMLHRIPATNRPPVLLLHGLFCSSADWLLAGPDRSLAFQLHDAGFDVWMANFRGSPYSLSHRDLTPRQAAFWNYSFHEQGVLDLRTVLAEMRINAAGPVTVVGHSLGTTALLALLAEHPDMDGDVAHAMLLAPIASLRGVASPSLRILAHYGHLIGRLLKMLGREQVMVMGGFTSRVVAVMCKPGAPLAELCKYIMFALVGHSPDLLDAELLPQVLVQLASSGSSVQSMVHLSECLVAEAFIKPVRRDRMEVTEYNLTAITVPLTLVYAKNDLLSGPQESMWLYNKLKGVASIYEVPHPTFNHLDFLYAVDAKRHLYNYVVEEVLRRRVKPVTSSPTTDSTIRTTVSNKTTVVTEGSPRTTSPQASTQENGVQGGGPDESLSGNSLSTTPAFSLASFQTQTQRPSASSASSASSTQRSTPPASTSAPGNPFTPAPATPAQGSTSGTSGITQDTIQDTEDVTEGEASVEEGNKMWNVGSWYSRGRSSEAAA